MIGKNQSPASEVIKLPIVSGTITTIAMTAAKTNTKSWAIEKESDVVFEERNQYPTARNPNNAGQV